MLTIAVHNVWMAARDPALATRIKRARERQRWTQRQLADRIGVDRKTVDNWENGRTTPRNSMGALEALLGTLGEDAGAEVYMDPAGMDDDELRIWNDSRYGPLAARKELIEVLRAQREKYDRQVSRSA